MFAVDKVSPYFRLYLGMGGERSSTTRMRLAGTICCLCGRHLDAMLWQPPGERVCEACEAQRSPIPKLRLIHMSFCLIAKTRGRYTGMASRDGLSRRVEMRLR